MNIEYHQGGGDSLRRYRSRIQIRRGQYRRFFIVCIIIVLMIFLASAANRSIKPISLELAKSYGSAAVLEVINDSVSELFDEENIGYSDIIRLRYSTSGFVTSIEYDSAAINRLKVDCLEILNKNLAKLRSAKIRVPVGSLFEDLTLSGRGPAINIRISESVVPDIELISTFDSVGLNQSRHEIRMRVSAQVRVYLPPRSAEFTVTQDYVLAQTVIVGDVPAGYAFLE